MNIPDILKKTIHLKIAVLGDLITDRYIFGDMTRISPEAPVPIFKVTSFKANPGGAGNVVENLRGLGAQVSFFHQPDVPVKTRVMSGMHHILRMDEENEPQWMKFDDLDMGLDYGILHDKYDCVIISDYGKGCVSEEVARETIIRCCKCSIPVVVDSKYNLDKFENATLLKCNLNEWDPESYLKKNTVEGLVITLGDKGMKYWHESGLKGSVPALPVTAADTCGAGDTVVAVLGIMTALGYPIDQACELANIAAAHVCRRPGVYAIQRKDLL